MKASITQRFESLTLIMIEHMPQVAALGLDWQVSNAYPFDGEPDMQPLVAWPFVETGAVRLDADLRKMVSPKSADTTVLVSFDGSSNHWLREDRKCTIQIGGKNGERWFDEQAPEAMRIHIVAKREKRSLTIEESDWLMQNTARSLHAAALMEAK